MENTECTVCNSSGILRIINAKTCRLAADKLYALITDEVIKCAHSITAAANTSHNHIRKSALFFEELSLNFLAYYALKISYNHREWMWAHYRTEYIVSIVNSVCPLTHSLVYCVFQNHCACFNRIYLCAEEFHSIYIKGLTDCVLLTHKNLALKSHKCGNRCGCYTMLTCACFGNYSCFAHFLGKQALTKTVIQLMRTCMV